MRLVDVLAMLEPRALQALANKNQVKIEPAKASARRTPMEQAAHALAVPKALFALDTLSPDARTVFDALVRAPHGLPRADLGATLLKLVERGLVFRSPRAADVFVMPATYRVQIAPSATDDLRSLRVLIARLDEETIRGIAGHVVGASTGISRVVLAGDVLSAFESDERLAQELSDAAPKEKSVFDALVARGGEVDVDEYSRITGELARPFTTSAAGFNIARRSLLFGLARRGLAYVAPGDLVVVSTEALRLTGRDPFGAAKAARTKLMERARTVDLAPSRVRFGIDPSAATVALFAALRAEGEVFKPNAGVSRTVLRRACKRAEVTAEAAEMLVALGRISTLTSRAMHLHEVGRALAEAWRAGQAWDEARVESDAFRAGERLASIPTPTRIVAHSVLALLAAVPKLRFLSREDLVDAVTHDLAVVSALKRFERVVARDADKFVKSVDSLIARILDVSLPALGLIDAGSSDVGAVLRLSTRARAWFAHESESQSTSPSHGKLSDRVIPVAPSVRVPQVLAAAHCATFFAVHGALVAEVDADALARATEHGLDVDAVLARLEPFAPSEALRAHVQQSLASRMAARVIGLGRLLVLEDKDAHARLLASPEAEEILLTALPYPHLLLRSDVQESAVNRWFSGVGARVMNGPTA